MQALLLRCDAGSAGLGHFARCRDLARLLRRRAPQLELTFAGYLPGLPQSSLRELGFEYLPLQAEAPLLVPELVRAAAGGARLILDSYRLDEAALGKLEHWPLPWGAFDDFARFSYASARLVINTRVGASAAPYRARHLALGSELFPATPELEDARRVRESSPPGAPVRRVLVFIGGQDHFGVGIELSRVAARVFAGAEVICFQAAAAAAGQSGVEVRPLGSDLAGELAQADLVLSGGGRLKYEAAFCGVPCASLSQTDGQAEDTAELARRGLCLDLGRAEALEATRVAAQLSELSQEPALRAMRALQARAFPVDAGQRLARLVSQALELA